MNTTLVSVVVITYNSSGTILDTLDSIYDQTYQNIELVICDDCSNDNTVALTEGWLCNHRERFHSVTVISHEANHGTVRNLNSGVQTSSGEWIKIIAGDDKMIPEAIQKYIEFCVLNQQCRMCVSDIEVFSDDGTVSPSLIDTYAQFFIKSNRSQKEQWKGIQKELFFTGPTYFFSRSLYEEIGGFDEDYILMEEWPFCFEVLKRGNRIFAIPEKLIKYRISPTSICHSKESGLGNKTLFMDKRRFFYKKRLCQLLSGGKLFYAYGSLLNYEIGYLKYKHDKKTDILILFLKILKPSCWFQFINHKFIRPIQTSWQK